VDPESAETVAMTAVSRPQPTTRTGERFAPGSLLASRYRIISRLGKGGMGEVFRADDLILGQPVALKFLPETAKGDVSLLTRFYDEVRIARQIGHKNVCRVYDIGEIEGQPYLSMEYIDGEDLASLLRRIGRLPGDKAVELARKLCAGVAAAHAQGVLHRDLKPANIMIDARGELKITDFGLAAIAARLEGTEIRSGTPAYMSPEQLAGKEVSPQSDIYALGLVLHEMFTGKQPFQADTVAGILKLRQETRVTNPSTLVPDLDKTVERAILRCLEPDPKMRPASALALAAALPGGDALAEALAAGETPSPEMVAASGSTEGLSLKLAVPALAGVAVVMAAVCWFVPKVEVLGMLPLENAQPEVLTSKARELVRTLGYTERPADSAWGFNYDSTHLQYAGNKISSPKQWMESLARAPFPVSFWYRQSPRPLSPNSAYSGGIVAREDPPDDVSGMLRITVDPEGRLLNFSAVPPQKADPVSSPPPPDWAPLFAAAHLDMTQFQQTEPQWTALAATDTRAAWSGVFPGQPDLPIRVEAAAFHGRPVFFAIVYPWTTPFRMPGSIPPQKWRDIGQNLISLLLTLASVVVARYNWKAGRGDPKGAVRVGLYMGTLKMAMWALGGHHAIAQTEQGQFFTALAQATYSFVLYSVAYLALEPWVRRYWPQTLITWSRLLAGRWRDPMVARDALFGTLFGLLLALLFASFEWLFMRFGESPNWSSALINLSGLRGVAYTFADRLTDGIAGGLKFFFMLFLLRALLKKEWLASAVFIAVWAAIQSSSAPHWVVPAVFWTLVYGIATLIMLRFGLFAMMLAVFVVDSLEELLFTTDLTAWYGLSSLAIVLALAALAVWGFRTSLGGTLMASKAS
jgi:serine/threonine-protein kinase